MCPFFIFLLIFLSNNPVVKNSPLKRVSGKSRIQILAPTYIMQFSYQQGKNIRSYDDMDKCIITRIETLDSKH